MALFTLSRLGSCRPLLCFVEPECWPSKALAREGDHLVDGSVDFDSEADTAISIEASLRPYYNVGINARSGRLAQLAESQTMQQEVRGDNAVCL